MAGGNRSGVRATTRIRADLRACRIPVTKPTAAIAGSLNRLRIDAFQP